jgi:hypothetical protein
MNNTFFGRISIFVLAALVVLGLGANSWAVTWSESFEGYADTTALKADYTQASITTNSGPRMATANSNDIILANDPASISGKVFQVHVIPKNKTGGSYYLWWWRRNDSTGSNLFPTGVFQNGTDFNVRYDVYTSSTTAFFGPNQGSGYFHKVGSVGTCMGAWTITDQNAPFIGNRGHSSNGGTFPQWTQLFAAWRGLDARLNNANANMNNGNTGSGRNPELMVVNTWYSCRLTVDWPSNGVTTNTYATCTFTVWPRGAAESSGFICTYASPNPWAAGPPAGDAAIVKGSSGATTGDGYGLFGMFENPDGDTAGQNYDQYFDNVAFVDSLTYTPELAVSDWQQY